MTLHRVTLLLTPSKTAQVGRGMAEAKRTITKAQELFKKFERVAEVRKEPSHV